MSKKGPRAKQVAQSRSTVSNVEPKNWLACIQKAMIPLATSFSEEKYQDILQTLKLTVPKQFDEKLFISAILKHLLAHMKTHLYHKDDSISDKVKYFNSAFSKILFGRMFCDLYRNTTSRKNYLYSFWQYLTTNLTTFSIFLTNAEISLEIQGPVLELYQSCYDISELYSDEYSLHLRRLTNAPSTTKHATPNFEDIFRADLFESYDKLISNQIEACCVWYRHDELLRLQQSYARAKSEYEYARKNTQAISAVTNKNPMILTNILNKSKTELSRVAICLPQEEHTIYLNSFTKASLAPIADAILRENIVTSFKNILMDVIETSAQLQQAHWSNSATTAIRPEAEATHLRLRALTTNIQQLAKEPNFNTRLSSVTHKHFFDTQEALLELRNIHEENLPTVSLREAMTLMLTWRVFFTTNQHAIPELVDNYIAPVINTLITLTRWFSNKINIPAAAPSSSSSPVETQAKTMISIIFEAGTIPASTKKEDYATFLEKHKDALKQHLFIESFVETISKNPLLIDEVEPDIKNFDIMNKSIQILEKRINVHQFVLTAFSKRSNSEHVLEILHFMWMSFSALFSNTAASFKANLIPPELVKIYYQRIERNYTLVQFHLGKYQSLIRSVNQKGKLSLGLKARLLRDQFLADSSFVIIHGAYADLSLRQFDLNGATGAIESAYQYLALIETKFKLGHHSNKRDMIDVLRAQLSDVVMQIYSPVFAGDPNRIAFSHFTLDEYRQAFKTPESRENVVEMVFSYIDNLASQPFLSFADLPTQERFLIATGHLLHFHKEIATDPIDFLNVWLHLNACFDLIENMPHSNNRLEHAKAHKALLDNCALQVKPLTLAAIHDDTSNYSQDMLDAANTALWNFYYNTILQQLQFCQIQAQHSATHVLNYDLDTLNSNFDVFNEHFDTIIEKSNFEKTLGKSLLEKLSIDIAKFKNELIQAQSIKPTPLIAMTSPNHPKPSNLNTQNNRGKKNNNKGKGKKPNHPLPPAKPSFANSKPVVVPSAPSLIKASPIWQELHMTEETPWKTASKKTRKKSSHSVTLNPLPPQRRANRNPDIINKSPLAIAKPPAPTRSSSTTVGNRNYAQALTGTYHPPADDTMAPATIIESDANPVTQLTLDIDALTLNQAACSDDVMPVKTLAINNSPVLSFRLALPPILADVYNRIKAHGFDVFVVGGFVRDSIFGLEPHDIDFVTNASREDIALIFNDAGYANEHRADLYHLNAYIDIISSNSPDLLTEARKRDLTFNALFLGDNGFIFDPLNIAHTLQSPMLHMIGEDHNQRLASDPTKILRLARFSNSTGKGISAELLALMQANSPAIASLPWGILKSNIRALFGRNQHQALLNLSFLVQYQMIGHLFSADAEEKNYYVTDSSVSKPYFYWKNALNSIYSSGSPQIIEIVCFLLSLRLIEYIQQHKSTSYQAALDQTAALLCQKMGSKPEREGEVSLELYIKGRITEHYINYFSPVNITARRKPTQSQTILHSFHNVRSRQRMQQPSCSNASTSDSMLLTKPRPRRRA